MSTTNVAAPMTDLDLDQLSINTIRTLSIDAVERAKSGHPGTPMALAPLVYTLWNRTMRFDPKDPIWPNRDRFVLSNGHASMLLWSALHLTGTCAVNPDYERLGQPSVTLDDIRHFRQIGSKAPGHPEYHLVSGVETTTGPLGQGVATSVGMAIAEKWLANRYNKPGFPIFDYDIYVVCGDGCLMEGVGAEAASLAGHLGLDNLCWIYDNNHITIEGSTSLAFSEDVATRFLAYGWNVLRVGDPAQPAAGRSESLQGARRRLERRGCECGQGGREDAERLSALLQRRRHARGQRHLCDVQGHRHEAVVADRADEIDDAAFAEGVLDALERGVRDLARRQELRDEVVDRLLVLGHPCGALVGRDGVGDGRAQSGLEGEPAMRVELVLRRPLAAGHDDRHLVQSLRDRAAEPHVGADALDEITELGASQQGVEGTAQAGTARA
jgi:transketolase N-terminal domain/subunit